MRTFSSSLPRRSGSGGYYLLSPVTKTSVSDLVLEQLLDLLLTGELRLGDKLPTEDELARQLGIGRNTVREAIKVLQVLGIIERRQGSGSFVATEVRLPLKPLLIALISVMGSVAEMVELRRVLEIGVIDVVIDKIDPKAAAPLRGFIDELRARGAAGASAAQLAESDLAFHYGMLDVTGDRAIVELMRLIMRLFEPSIEQHLAAPEAWRRVADEHEEILSAVMSGNREAARKAVLRSYEFWRSHIELPNELASPGTT